jgi:hypothetical protein
LTEKFVQNRKSLRLVTLPNSPATDHSTAEEEEEEEEDNSSNAAPAQQAQDVVEQDATPSTLAPTFTPQKLKKVLEALQEALQLEKELFALPIEIQTLLPDYCRTINPQHFAHFQSRILELSRKLEDILHVQVQTRALLSSEAVSVALSQTIKGGQKPIDNIVQWVKQTFPKNLPTSQQPIVLVSGLLHWYIHLSECWEQILEKDTPTHP